MKQGDGYEEKLLTKAINAVRQLGKGEATQSLAAAFGLVGLRTGTT